MGVCAAVCLVIVTIFFPPLGVWAVAGCGIDLFINICLTILGYFPGHIHAFYLEYVYYDRKQQAREGHYPPRRAPGIYSDKVQTGGQGYRQGYGTMAPPVAAAGPVGGQPYESQPYGNQPQGNQGYGNQGYGNQGYA
ncbi:plasma membrane proteolipid 3 [Trichoderma arundinaceum]|uniref:Plasma membrane proteolipid 3 n=1 Tax=Trichoderma arundinaceum TaxID=490622 RepID=A0A395NBP7_TRIAR|nr:plasma membrane proteolipid 3 [Trichoderma arundinaceum]